MQAEGRGGRGWERGFLSLFARLYFVSVLLHRLPAPRFASFTLCSGAALLWSVCEGLELLAALGGAGHPFGKVLGFG